MTTTLLVGLALAVTITTVVMMHPYATAQAPANLCMDADTRDKTRALMFEGINVALVHHTERLFDNLMKDRGSDPERMTRGMYTALSLYARSRENLLKWNPPACESR